MTGTLMMIGGNEDKIAQRTILRELARRVGNRRLVVATLASEEPDYQWATYSQIFHELGLTDVRHLAAETREEAADITKLELIDEQTCLFFSGGDQLKITTKLGGTALYERIRALYKHHGQLIAGTSAGAACMGQVMLMSAMAEGSEKHKLERAFIMARGLSLVRDMVIDQHFAQRARIERLLGALAENPGVLGVGIDEDTAVIVSGPHFEVIGSGAVYVADGSNISYTNATDPAPGRTLCLFDVRLHVLNNGSQFDIAARRPYRCTDPAC
jgi:cyanophycinase